MPESPVLTRIAHRLLQSGLGRSRVCYVDLPRAGLGHRLLVWAKGLSFAWTNDLPVFVSPWPQLKIGPLLRGERHARLYFDTFADPQSLDPLRGKLLLRLGETVIDPPLERLPDARAGAPFTVYVFREPLHWTRAYEGIREHRERVRGELHAMLVDRRRRELAALPPPMIGVHVRQGDFRPLAPGEDITKTGHVRAPLSYFKARILGLRALAGKSLPVTLFSDGHDRDLADLLSLPDVRRAPRATDIVDLLLLSRSRILLGAPGSSFSELAGFLSEAILLKEPHFHGPTRPQSVNARVFEGPVGDEVDAWPAELREAVRALVV